MVHADTAIQRLAQIQVATRGDRCQMLGDMPWVELTFALLGGAALLMYGIQLTSEGLEEASGPRMRRLLGVMTKNVYLGFLVGTIVVALVGSSTAVSVMTVGFVNAGVIDLRQACGIIYGANVGTTSDAIAIALVMSVEKLNLKIVSLGMIAVGFVLMFFTKRRKFRSPGKAIFGFGLVFLALALLSSGATHLKESESAALAFAALGKNPLLGVLVGTVATFLVHSSSTTVAMNLALAQAGLLNIEASLALILGDNIGTCLTAQIAAVGTSIPARRTAWAHTLHNVIGVMLALAFFPLLVKFALWISPEVVRQIAFTHGLFNVASAMLFLPLTGPFVALLRRIVPGEVVVVEAGPQFIDKLFLDHPEMAKSQVRRAILRMS
jgi:phosphate:Na+ symporter